MKQFSEDFMLGAATASHQVDGNNIHSDYWVQEHLTHSVLKEPSGMAVDHYSHYEEDIKYLAGAGLNTYRFSIEWARIQPKEDEWEQREVEHYRKVIKCCKENGVKPILTLHHFSSPAWLITKGGWENPEVAVYFEKYCKRVVSELSEELDGEYICTINEANMRLQLAALIKDMMKRMAGNSSVKSAESSVQVGVNLAQDNMMKNAMESAAAFGVDDPRKVATFVSQCTSEGDLLVMKAHQAAKAAIKSVNPNIKVGLTLSLHDMQPYSGGEEFAEKDWEDEFTHYLPYIKDDDFLGVQCYTRKRYDENGVAQPTEGMRRTLSGYEDYPMAIANVVRRVSKQFKNTIIVTENGIATDNDKRRCEFIKEACEGIMDCIDDGINIKGYMYWSLLDNFEWQKGFDQTFGLIAVDRSTMKRTVKESLSVLGSLIKKG